MVDPKPASPVKRWASRGAIVALGLLVTAAAFVAVCYKTYYIPSEAMVPTLIVGDRFVALRSWVVPEIQRGDVVVALANSNASYVKRVIGMPGDRLQIRGGVVIINGNPIRRSAPKMTALAIDANQPCTDARYAAHAATKSGKRTCSLPYVRETLPDGRGYVTVDLGYDPFVDDYAETIIPDDHYFLLGDNRDNSADSRVPANLGGLGGPVSKSRITGRAESVSQSFDGSENWWNPSSWIRAQRSGRAGTSLHPSKTG